MRAVTASVEQVMAETHTQTAIAPTARAASNETLFQRVWPAAFVVFALAVNVAWIALLGYGVVSLVKFAF